MNAKLINSLANVQGPIKIWTSTDGSRAVVLPYGGRVLGLLAPIQKKTSSGSLMERKSDIPTKQAPRSTPRVVVSN